ncbi:hypothetical protein J1N35_003260 [Gossypium stocksii]|uniref:DUF3511 domain-containing protein n=1 Tax=Gossypium stocksii TaxID=47602 RepID=A0A9D4ANL5_9ROSI|nr:hypothetical protein J1N35_003260 [Gossypium stocksii]
MENFRSKSCREGKAQQIESKNGINGMQYLRCYTASNGGSTMNNGQTQIPNNVDKFKKSKSSNGSCSKSWNLNDPELRRKKRVASYRVYSVEGKVKGSLKKSFRWLKERYVRVVYGWW